MKNFIQKVKLTYLIRIFKCLNQSPPTKRTDIFRALVFDIVYQKHRGAIIYVACFGTEIKVGDKIKSCYTKKTYEIQELGLARPSLEKAHKL